MKNIKRRFRILTPLTLLIEALGLIALGIVMLVMDDFVMLSFYHLIVAGLLFFGLLSILSFIIVPHRRMATTLISGITALGLGVWIHFYPAVLGVGLGLLIGLWALLNALVQLGYAVQLRYTKCGGEARYVITGILILAFAVAMFIEPRTHLNMARSIVSVYFIFWGASLFLDFYRELFRLDLSELNIKRHLHLTMPVLLTAFAPSRIIDRVNKALENERWEPINDLNAPKDMEEGPLEIIFHFGRHVAMGFGHVDLCFHGRIYSYGCYDMDAHKLFGLLSDGVFLIAPREEYMDYSVEQEKKTMIVFTLYLTQRQDKQVRSALKRILDNCAIWTPADDAKGGLDVSSPRSFLLHTKCTFYKFKSGPYQTYNAFKTNCAALVAMVTGETNLPIMPNTGIITPGTYYTYLNRQFEKKNSIVVKRTTYGSMNSSISPDDNRAVQKELRKQAFTGIKNMESK